MNMLIFEFMPGEEEKWNALSPEERDRAIAVYHQHYHGLRQNIALYALLNGVPPVAVFGLAVQAVGGLMGETVVDPKERALRLDQMARVLKAQADISARQGLAAMKPEGKA